ncbi:T9SS type A sorting domain-containing protein [Cytophaga hutchinsonii]|uniref:Secretion system C-terminal sorting domain-containing protein n=1 Tax=Cytophaga hutchinsonii (strain ATCC 33406 / DSM 1761 / CIP 103989 / NBRC 15051 / NCIMB 9469 / D465) TaxID=269798 RepID=A0A6N4SQ20_CYTH3|nr:T9SS type A sorting domain-containing protein [Cytophaga hutchinsonii]ABG58381.1 conserved hypothetical protein [Cytophaga hutchinsonii ATCC 33406]SFX51344.1 Por secretion system C-terminal sorting domain-containing protein [Cytophaga hutchinsonii ATCC 33406]
MKKFYVFLLAAAMTATANGQSQTRVLEFNATTDLTDKFNDDGSPEFTNEASGGIGNSGSINVPDGSSDLWTTKEGYSVSGVGDKYVVEAFFKVAANSGYGGVGLAVNSQNENNSPGYAAQGLGVTFHGGGGSFHSNAESFTLDWYSQSGDLVLGNWYKLVFTVESVDADTYDLNMKVYNADSDGNVGTIFTEQSEDGVVNADIGGASTLHTYFSSNGSRMQTIDNYKITLEGGISIIEEGAPVVITADVNMVESSAASSGGNVLSENGAAVIARGVCWSTTSMPTIEDNKTEDGTGAGAFTSALTGLSASTTYYLRAYAINESGTSYGSEISFTTAPVTTGVVKNNAGVIQVFPNPTNKEVVLTLSSAPATVQVNVMEANGRVVSRKEFNATANLDIEIDGIAGMYFVEVTTSDNKSSMIKIIKQ